MTKLKRWWVLLALVPILVLSGFVVWATMASTPMDEALVALQSNPQVRVDTEPWLIFQPDDGEPAVGLILCPGGRVDPRAYAPTAHAIASHGHLAVIVPVPLNLAFLAPDRAADFFQGGSRPLTRLG